MLNLFERNDQKTRDLLYSLKQAGFERPTVFLVPAGSSHLTSFTQRFSLGAA